MKLIGQSLERIPTESYRRQLVVLKPERFELDQVVEDSWWQGPQTVVRQVESEEVERTRRECSQVESLD